MSRRMPQHVSNTRLACHTNGPTQQTHKRTRDQYETKTPQLNPKYAWVLARLATHTHHPNIVARARKTHKNATNFNHELIPTHPHDGGWAANSRY